MFFCSFFSVFYGIVTRYYSNVSEHLEIWKYDSNVYIGFLREFSTWDFRTREHVSTRNNSEKIVSIVIVSFSFCRVTEYWSFPVRDVASRELLLGYRRRFWKFRFRELDLTVLRSTYDQCKMNSSWRSIIVQTRIFITKYPWTCPVNQVREFVKHIRAYCDRRDVNLFDSLLSCLCIDRLCIVARIRMSFLLRDWIFSLFSHSAPSSRGNILSVTLSFSVQILSFFLYESVFSGGNILLGCTWNSWIKKSELLE